MINKNPSIGKNRNNKQYIDDNYLNDTTYLDYLHRMEKIATSIFEWVNLPESMDARYLEKNLFYYGQCALLYDEKYGYINTKCSSGGYVNIYGLPTSLNCFSYEYQADRKLFTGLKENGNLDKDKEQAVLVMNNFDRLPTISTIQLFAYRLYLAQRSADVNVIATRHPVLLIGTEQQKLTLENLYNQYNGNKPFIFGDSDIISADMMKAIDTKAPIVLKDLSDYKKEIWNEFLTFIGVNNIDVEKKERLISGEESANNESINLNLQSYLITRQLACKQFNKLFNLTGDKEVKVRVRSDLFNIIKQEESIITDYGLQKEMESNE